MSENFAETYYFVDSQGSRYGPISETDFIARIGSGEILPDTPVWREGESAWAPLKSIRGKWFPVETTKIPSFERISASTSLRSVFSDTWQFLFSGNHFWLLLGGGILWQLIECAVASFPGGNLICPLISGFIVFLVFLIFVRKWDRGEAPVFGDTFPLKSFFFLPWLRALGTFLLSGIAVFACMFLASAVIGGGIVGVCFSNPELSERCDRLLDKTIETANALNKVNAQGEFPQVSLETEHESDEALPEVERIEVSFPDNPALSEELQKNAHLMKTIVEGYAEIAEVVFESPIFWLTLAVAFPFAGLALFFSVRFMFAAYLPFDTDTGIIDSLGHSWKLSAGNFWKIFILGLILGLTLLFGTLLTFGLGFIVLYPYSLAAWAIFYVKLVKSRPKLRIPPSRL